MVSCAVIESMVASSSLALAVHAQISGIVTLTNALAVQKPSSPDGED